MERKGVLVASIHAENDSCASPQTKVAFAEFLSDPRTASQDARLALVCKRTSGGRLSGLGLGLAFF